ncbi:RNA-directed DNA polymerase, eukaryota, reverse transcriptase zinc-binding domain protein, partial [Tanacetum coccineum]
FSEISGLHPNLGKCTMFCGSLKEDTKKEIGSIFQFREGKLPVRYLGVPLVTKKIGANDCKQLVDKIKQRLNDWKNKSLSYAGRAQLIASVLGSMQVYWGSVFLLPKGVINDIERLFKKFLWNIGDSGKGRAKVAWIDVCKPKDQGGLGFKSLELWNKTLLVKHLWNVAAKKESLWVKWINVVKLKQRSVWDIDIDSKDSWGWKCILSLRSWIGNHMRYRIGNGENANVWHDRWHKDISLSSTISKKEVFYAGFHDQNTVSDLINENGWRWPQDWLVKHPWLGMIHVPVLSNTPDKLVWVDNDGNDRSFSTNNVWKDVRGTSEKVNWCKLVWHTNCIPKHSFILWLAAKKKLCTQDRLAKWYPNRTFECSLCQKGLDSHDHLFFNCDYTQKFWSLVCDIAKIKFSKASWDDNLNEMSKGCEKQNVWVVIRKLCFGAAIYYIWHERNSRLFNNCKKEAADLFASMMEEIKARLVSITVKESNNNSIESYSILDSSKCNEDAGYGLDIMFPAKAVGQLGDALAVGLSCWTTAGEIENRSFTLSLVMPPIRALMFIDVIRIHKHYPDENVSETPFPSQNIEHHSIVEKYGDENLGGAQENLMQPNIKVDDPRFEGVIYILVGYTTVSLLVWNVQGAGSSNFFGTLKEIVRINHQEVIALVETHLDGDRAERLGRQIQYDGHARVDAEGHSGAVLHLPGINSDHAPLLIKTNGFVAPTSGHKPFRFLSAWLSHQSFETFVKTMWRNDVPIVSFLNQFAENLQEWNKTTFGNIFRQKRHLWARIAGLQKAIAKRRDRYLLKLEARLLLEFK